MADYPGSEYRMSNYGPKNLSPHEVFEGWKENCSRHDRLHHNHIAIRGDGSTSFPGISKPTPEEMQNRGSFFNEAGQGNKHDVSSTYDRMFHIDYDYNCKIHRDDRQHTKFVGLDIPTEECNRSVPVRSSTEYGRRVEKPMESSSRTYSRVDRVMKGFYRTRGTGIPASTDPQQN